MQVAKQSVAQTFEVNYHDGKRFVLCEYCKSPAETSIVTHLKKKHPQIWRDYVAKFVEQFIAALG